MKGKTALIFSKTVGKGLQQIRNKVKPTGEINIK